MVPVVIQLTVVENFSELGKIEQNDFHIVLERVFHCRLSVFQPVYRNLLVDMVGGVVKYPDERKV